MKSKIFLCFFISLSLVLLFLRFSPKKQSKLAYVTFSIEEHRLIVAPINQVVFCQVIYFRREKISENEYDYPNIHKQSGQRIYPNEKPDILMPNKDIALKYVVVISEQNCQLLLAHSLDELRQKSPQNEDLDILQDISLLTDYLRNNLTKNGFREFQIYYLHRYLLEKPFQVTEK